MTDASGNTTLQFDPRAMIRDPRLPLVGGSALVAAAVVISGLRTRGQGDIDWSNYAMGILGTLALIGFAAGAYYLVEGDPRTDLVAWPGAMGAVGAGTVIGVGWDNNGDAETYVVGLLISVLAVAGFWYARHPAWVVAALIGLSILYVQVFDDVLGFGDFEDDNGVMTTSIAVFIFMVAVTLGGWYFPATRDISGVLVGALAVFAQLMILAGLGIGTAIAGAFSSGVRRDDRFDNDIWVMLFITLLMIAVWAWANWQSGHPGYRILIAAAIISIVPAATMVLAVHHPTYWEGVLGLAGAALLGYIGLGAIGGPEGLKRLQARGPRGTTPGPDPMP